MSNAKAKKPGKVSLVLMCVLLVAALIVNVVCVVMRGTLDMYMGSKPELSHELAEAGEDLALRIEREGIVLLQNNGTLPLSKEIKKVNVFGWSATQWINGGDGSGQCATLNTDFLAALKDYGISYNEDLIKMYRDFLGERPYVSEGSLGSWPEQLGRLYEPSVSDGNYYTDALLASAKEYSDTAIMVLGRFTGESNDCPNVQYRQTVKNGEVIEDSSRTYLDLSPEEEELLVYLGENYENVVVLVNTTNALALGALETTPGVDAALMVGGTGENAAKAIPEVLFGDVNPSGRLTDTYVYDFKTAPSYANIGKEGTGAYTNGEGLYPWDGTANCNLGESGDGWPYPQLSFVDYVEGIYVGYKWYETADAEGYWDSVSNQYGSGYEGVVQYPFGYGLSYTTFDWDVINAPSDALDKDGKVEVTVKVTNTGSAAGKDVVQLYYAAPYLSGEIEKAAKSLADYAKTDLLQPGESQELTLALDVYDMASYDCYDANRNGFTGFELDAGSYTFYVSRNAHEAVNEFICTLSSGVQYAQDPVTGAPVGNLFTGPDAVDGVSLDGSDSNSNIIYLTRADFKGTFPTKRNPDRALTDNAAALNLFTAEMAQAWIDPNDAPITTGAKNGLSVTNPDGTISELGLQLGANYDDPQWEKLLDQMTMEEMQALTLHGYVHTEAIPSIGKPQTQDLDGPTQVGSFSWNNLYGTGFPNPVTLAQTFNKDLAYEFGLISGAEARQLGVDGLYAPAANMHRTPFGARNYEYYSEDSYISGMCATLTVKGSLEAGTFMYVKHFICNDADAYLFRDSVYTWMTEQALREIYLSPFKMMVQEGGCTGLMSSYNRIGAVWAGGSEALLQRVLRDEWGFHGAVITDYSDHQSYMNGNHSIRNGGDLWMDGWLSDGTYEYDTTSNSFCQAVRQGSKNIIYMTLNAQAVRANYAANGGNSLYLTEENESLNQWLTLLIIFDVVVIAIEAVYFTLRIKKSKQA